MGGDLEDRAACEGAARDVDAVFAVATPFEPGVEAEVRQGQNMLAAAKTAGVRHLVYSSVASADQSTGIPHFDSKFEIEQQIKASAVPSTIVAPVYFMENLFAPSTVPGLREGKLAMALPADRVLQQIAVEDIATFVVLALEHRERFLGTRIDIAGDEVTGEQAADILTRASGRQIEYVEIAPEQRRPWVRTSRGCSTGSTTPATASSWTTCGARIRRSAGIPTRSGQTLRTGQLSMRPRSGAARRRTSTMLAVDSAWATIRRPRGRACETPNDHSV